MGAGRKFSDGAGSLVYDFSGSAGGGRGLAAATSAHDATGRFVRPVVVCRNDGGFCLSRGAGGLFHSGTALLPFIYAAAVVGLDVAVEWAAARRRRWDADLARQFFGVSLVIMAMALSGFIYYNRVIKNDAWNSADRVYTTVAAWITGEDPTATVMINNPPPIAIMGAG